MSEQTPLYAEHERLGGKMVPFAGFAMPLNYGSQIKEHSAVRQDAGMFDVSHMLAIDVIGAQAEDFLRYLFANDVAKLASGKALYTCLLNHDGGVLDDMICYKISAEHFRVVSNASTREQNISWFGQHADQFAVTIKPQTTSAIIAVQGPKALAKLEQAEPQLASQIAPKPPFAFVMTGDMLVARTGYTGEDGVEVILPAEQAPDFWRSCEKSGILPCGLGARDTLRLEAGLNLYGNDMDTATSPLEANLAWTVDLKDQTRQFIGRAPVEALKQGGCNYKLTGITLEGKGVLRAGFEVTTSAGAGLVTSGSFAPSLQKSIGFARVPVNAQADCTVTIRGKKVAARLCSTRFLSQNKK